ncbi:hypothetical protein D3C71_1215610 [compost metagenome]
MRSRIKAACRGHHLSIKETKPAGYVWNSIEHRPAHFGYQIRSEIFCFLKKRNKAFWWSYTCNLSFVYRTAIHHTHGRSDCNHMLLTIQYRQNNFAQGILGKNTINIGIDKIGVLSHINTCIHCIRLCSTILLIDHNELTKSRVFGS